MIIEDANYVEVFDINNAWRDAMWLCVRKGYDFVVEKGSYEGQIRKQLSDIKIVIREPWTRPLEPIMPPSIPPPTDAEKIKEYFREKLIGNVKKGNEQYTYGEFIEPQLPRIIELLSESRGNTNQACITVGEPASTFLSDPPCLKVVSFKVVNKQLEMSVFFRSWDLISGLPQNLGGLQLLKEYVLVDLPEELKITDGRMIAYSDGLHIYDQYFEISDMLNVDKIEVSDKVWQDKEEFSKTLE
ncbi:thymidylate synthase [Patescibacteria group bacterium]